METKSKFIQKVKEFVATGKTREAIEFLIEEFKAADDKYLNEAYFLLNRINELSKERVSGTIDYQTAQIELAKINNSIFELLEIWKSKVSKKTKKSKVFLVFSCVFILSIFLYFLVGQTRSFGNAISGKIVFEETNIPLANAKVEVFNNLNLNITKGLWETDDNGFYFLMATEDINSLSSLKVTYSECDVNYFLPLKNTKLIKSKRKKIVTFMHQVEKCK